MNFTRFWADATTGQSLALCWNVLSASMASGRSGIRSDGRNSTGSNLDGNGVSTPVMGAVQPASTRSKTYGRREVIQESICSHLLVQSPLRHQRS